MQQGRLHEFYSINCVNLRTRVKGVKKSRKILRTSFMDAPLPRRTLNGSRTRARARTCSLERDTGTEGRWTMIWPDIACNTK